MGYGNKLIDEFCPSLMWLDDLFVERDPRDTRGTGSSSSINRSQGASHDVNCLMKRKRLYNELSKQSG